MSCKLQIERKDSMPSFFVSDTNSLYKTNVSYLDTEDNKWATWPLFRIHYIQ